MRCIVKDMLFKGALVFQDAKLYKKDVLISDGLVKSIATSLECPEAEIIDATDCVLTPGFVDVHVHFREPGFEYKETIETGSKAAARGGYTTVCTMPNLNPVPDSPEHIAQQLAAIKDSAVIEVLPYAAITVGRAGKQLCDFAALKGSCFALTDDGSGVQSDEMMLEAMKLAVEQDMMIAAHCEDNSLLRGGYIHDGNYCREHGHKGICSESEWGQIARDLKLAEQTGCRYHVCHISTKESVAIIREAKKRGVKVTCETGPHYLTLCDADLQEDGRFKMNPPLRAAEDMQALIEGIKDGTIDVIATDHAPHSAEEKSKGLAGSAMGVVGIETAFPVLYTKLVRPGIISLELLLSLMSESPRKTFGLAGGMVEGAAADLCLIDLNKKYTINPDQFISKGHSTPFEGWEVWGDVLMTLKDGQIVWKQK
ncbi:MAG: dihydroorotase [Bacteroidales bacterium]|nr:dihydroorotase [Bacteroidales bacterium]MBQ5583092.1 dihydroorotase [Bacteroidales bacterium]